MANTWTWVAGREEARTDRGARRFVVELAHAKEPIRIRVHTILDGTPVLTRWLEIVNTGRRPMALTAVYP